MVTLETARLRLRSFRADDLDAYARLCADPEVMRLVSVDGKPMSRFAAWPRFCAQISFRKTQKSVQSGC